MMQVGLPSRIFTFLALGIPVITSEENRFIAEFIEVHGIGISISGSEVRNLSALLDSVDYAQVQSNVLKARKKFTLEKMKDQFVGFINEARTVNI